MKIRVLFVQESLRLAGSEKSLVTLLKNLDPEKYEIDLQLMNNGGELERELPEFVKLLPELQIKKAIGKSLLRLPSPFNKLNRNLWIARIRYSLIIRNRKLKHSEKAQIFWEIFKPYFPNTKSHYDVAIGFAQGFPTFFVADKALASKRVCWVNANMKLSGTHRDYQERYYQKFDKVVCITNQNMAHMLKQLPTLKNLTVIENIIDYKEILGASKEKSITFRKGRTNILTVGRLNNSSKGMDIAIEAANHLREKSKKFHWYFLGEGPYRSEMEEFIRTHQLEEYVTLLGTDKNPYPYFVAADIYAQTSRHEGFGRTIAEARMLNVPIVSTRFDTISQQITHESNGLITDLDGKKVAEGIYRLMSDSELYESIKKTLMSEPKENLESVQKFDKLMSS